jgi:DNA-binding winged helix-turn-helix (wHTH) protein
MLIRIGKCYLNTEEMSLLVDEQSIILEPKVFAVLMYFIEHNDRYISMTELHQNLWQDRCVSDAAVRRIISKIRSALGDDHKEPAFLQSLPKRGYKLICSIEEVSSIETEQPSNIHIPTSQRKKYNLILATFSIVFICALFVYFLPKNNHDDPLTVIDTITSEKRSLGVSNNGKYIAFSNRLSHESNYQIYLKNLDNQSIKPLTDTATLPIGLAFSDNDRYLYFSDNDVGSAKIKRISLTNPANNVEVLVSDFHFITSVFFNKNDNSLFFTGQKQPHGSMLLYKLNRVGGLIEEVTSVAQKGMYDSYADISPDMSKIAVLRVFLDSKRNNIRILDPETGNTLFNYDHHDVIYSLRWLNDEHLVFADKKQLIKLNIKTGNTEVVMNTTVTALNILNPHTLLAIKTRERLNTFIEKKLPMEVFKTAEVIQSNNTEQGRITTYHSLGNKVWMIEKRNKVNYLTLHEKHNSASKVELFQTEQPLKLISPSKSGQNVLLKHHNRTAIFNVITNTLNYVSKTDELIGDVSFSDNEDSILYSIKTDGEWQVFEQTMADRTNTLLFKGYRYIREFEGGYIVGDEWGNLSRFDAYNNSFTALPITLPNDAIVNWAIVEDRVLWSNYNLIGNTTFYEMNINDVDGSTLLTQEFPFNEVRPYFYVDKINNLIIIKRLGKQSTEIVSLSI